MEQVRTPILHDPSLIPVSQTPHPLYRPHRTRNRLAVSCNHCRVRRMKCDRAKPCDACIKSGDSKTCQYMTKKLSDEANIASATKHLEGRINKLERLLLSVVPNGTQLSPSNEHNKAEEFKDVTASFGVMNVNSNANTSVYLGAEHWVSILSEIDEFREYLHGHEHAPESTADQAKKPSDSHISLLFPNTPPITVQEVVSQIPSQDITEYLVEKVFTSSGSAYVIHAPTFRKEIKEFFKAPEQAELTWLALLCMMLHLSTLDADRDLTLPASASELLQESDHYKALSTRCLVAANYTEPVKYTIETLLLYLESELLQSQDSRIQISLMCGLTVRLAMRMGYHRDSRAYPSISVFQGEMRRRIWSVLMKLDIFYSLVISLPTCIRQDEIDSALPSNLYDEDFDQTTTKLPASRPLEEPTRIGYNILKVRLMLILGKITNLTYSRHIPNPAEILECQGALEAAHSDIPAHLQVTANTIADPGSPSLQLRRIFLDRIYSLSLCTLHRIFLSLARHDASYAANRRVCIESALTLLNHQAALFLNDKMYPDNLKRRHLCSLTTTDFYIAAMAIALDLHYGFELEPAMPSTSDLHLWGQDRRLEFVTALEVSIEFWRLSGKWSQEASKAYSVFSFIVAKAKRALAAAGVSEVQSSALIPDGLVVPQDVAPSDGQGVDWSQWYQQDLQQVLDNSAETDWFGQWQAQVAESDFIV